MKAAAVLVVVALLALSGTAEAQTSVVKRIKRYEQRRAPQASHWRVPSCQRFNDGTACLVVARFPLSLGISAGTCSWVDFVTLTGRVEHQADGQLAACFNH